ncbi:bacteriophage spanin2 family protein [Goodfellowiella coeruleoviolacea]|uniref:Uncharacterized protein n=1 Tax=Goodfellowiella coeruleoviolacea TaxID=334858 RepID=A0AAE3GDW0_9PSEU|nr:bacteriophage spanin2 family protein [Goodfellowiella coeruleoviolacea]MCP2165494.1 hypothetical protein [Goodfellowiella coeruleoviolacea]
MRRIRPRPLFPRPVSTVLLGLGVSSALVLTGCAEVEQVADSVSNAGDVVASVTDRAGVCTEALRLAGFAPDLGSPEQAVDQAHKAAEELTALSAQTADEAVRTAVTDLATSLEKVSLADLDAESGLRWVEQKAEQVEALARACS